MKLHTGDTVIVISGKDKGKAGQVIRVLSEDNHVVVSGINMRTRHIKKTPQQAGRILRYEASLDASKVMVVDPKTKKPTRIGFVFKDGKKVRIAKRSGEPVVKVKIPKQAAAKKEAAAPTAGEEAKMTATGKQQPFWKRMQFGSAASIDEVGAPDESRSAQDHTIPGQNIPNKTSGRGS